VPSRIIERSWELAAGHETTPLIGEKITWGKKEKLGLSFFVEVNV
jgi:hypothetical protein